jgi:hypothetical protein
VWDVRESARCALDDFAVDLVTSETLDVPKRLALAQCSKQLGHWLDDRSCAVDVKRELLAPRALRVLGGCFAGERRAQLDCDLVEREVLAFAAAHRGAHVLDRVARGALAVGGRELVPLGAVGRLADEVDGDGVARARECRVGPLVGKRPRRRDDLRTLHGRALATVSGQRVGVLEMLGDVATAASEQTPTSSGSGCLIPGQRSEKIGEDKEVGYGSYRDGRA